MSVGSLALSVAVQCRTLTDTEIAEASSREAAMKARCNDGCLSCTWESSNDREDLIFGCAADHILVGISDLAFAVESNTPPWHPDEGFMMCQSKTRVVPRGAECGYNDVAVARAKSRLAKRHGLPE